MPDVVAASERVDALPRFDVCASLLSLPHHFGTTLQTIPTDVPYLQAPKSGFVIPSAPVSKRLKVGIAWTGNARHRNNSQRSCGVSFFRDLIDQHPNVAFYSLQVGESGSHADLFDLGPQLSDWGATAAAISQLDLVISVDTGVAHLAGALAKPVWTLLAYMPDPRWLLDRDDSPWYPTMRLYRQQRYGDWHGVFRQVDEALAARNLDLEPLVTSS
ncbi:MAG: hypothetical protein L0219_21415 [Phycisphaerales bacterium]|nr:hypothetical protein [Phycisphaerales bacterium]